MHNLLITGYYFYVFLLYKNNFFNITTCTLLWMHVVLMLLLFLTLRAIKTVPLPDNQTLYFCTALWAGLVFITVNQ